MFAGNGAERAAGKGLARNAFRNDANPGLAISTGLVGIAES